MSNNILDAIEHGSAIVKVDGAGGLGFKILFGGFDDDCPCEACREQILLLEYLMSKAQNTKVNA